MLIEYIHNIFGSDINTSLDKSIYIKYNINTVINCTSNIGFLDIDIKKIRIPIFILRVQDTFKLMLQEGRVKRKYLPL